MTGTDSKRDTQGARGNSLPVLYELIDKGGRSVARNVSAVQLGIVAKHFWPDQEQDEDRTGKGWDIQVVGCDS